MKILLTRSKDEKQQLSKVDQNQLMEQLRVALQEVEAGETIVLSTEALTASSTNTEEQRHEDVVNESSVTPSLSVPPTPLCKEARLALDTETFLKKHYDLRHNTLMGDVEVRTHSAGETEFRPIDKRMLNSIAIRAHQAGIPLWDRDLARHVYSERVRLFNPLEHFLGNLPAWDGIDRIEALAHTVPCANPHWKELFHRWFLNMVAHWRDGADSRFANSVSPLLVGAQGTRKSTFCRNLLPPELRAYYTDSIDFSRKRDAELYLNRFALINMDEFDQIGITQQGFLKHILQKPVVNVRKPYATAVQELHRYASFIATSNQKDLLSDPTGSRRFICIEVTAPINTDIQIDYAQLYAQALHEIAAGVRYWFNEEDEYIMTEANHDFEQTTIEEQLFYRYFRPANEGEPGIQWLSPAEMMNEIRLHTRLPLSQKRVSLFGRALQKHGVKSKRANRGTVYCVVKV